MPPFAPLLMEEKKEEAVQGGEQGGSRLSAQHHVYIQSDKHGWIPARVRSLDRKTKEAVVALDHYEDEQDMLNSNLTGEGELETTINFKDYPGGLLPLQNISNETGELVACEDMVDMPYMHEVRTVQHDKISDEILFRVLTDSENVLSFSRLPFFTT